MDEANEMHGGPAACEADTASKPALQARRAKAHGGKGGFRPGAGPAAQAYAKRHGIKPPAIIAWEITRSCNLACAHCRAAAHREPYPGELSLAECKAVIDDIASMTDPILILTGGEPLLRPDIWEIIAYARAKGLHPVIGTNGTLIDDRMAACIAEAGIPKVSVSLDFPDAAGQDAFRGAVGAFDQTLAGIANLRAHGVDVQVNTTVTRSNARMVDELHDLAARVGASDFHPFLLVPTGRGEDLVDVELSPDEYEEVLTWAYHRQKTSCMTIKPTDAPQYYRILRQQAAAEGIKVTPATHGHAAVTRGCLGGVSFVFVSHTGDVQPCGYFDMQLGNVRKAPLSQIWATSPVFDDLRHYDRLKGKCGACGYRGVCGGCRARALAATGDYLAPEPYCSYVPPEWAREQVLDVIQSGFAIDPDPYQRIAERVGLSAAQVRQTVEELYEQGTIRRIGASLVSRKLGYTSTLCAMAVPGGEEELARVAAIVGAHPQVTHNYGRKGHYNLWFTPITASVDERERLLDDIRRRSDIDEVLDLPARKLHKIHVDFGTSRDGRRIGGASACESAAAKAEPVPFDGNDPFDVELVRWVQGDVARDPDTHELLERPYAYGAETIGRALGRAVSEEQVTSRIAQLVAAGAIRRFGAVVRHRSMGYSHNSMTVWDIPDDQAERAGNVLASPSFVSHVYCRPRAESWPFNLYAMCHARSEEELGREMAGLADALADAGVTVRRHDALVTTHEYKKASMRYFEA